MPVLLGLDTGGTYTDAVLFDPQRGVLASAKALTTKYDLAIGLRHAVNAVLPEAAVEIALVSLSTTLATNAIVERHGSPICLLLMGYEPDALDKAGLRQALGDDPVVFLRGGHDAVGDEQAPLDLGAARAAILEYAPRVAAFAVSGFFSVRNPAHEIALRDVIRELTDRPVTCGHELTSRLDAPRRALTTALNARLIPQLSRLVRAVDGLLREKGIDAPRMIVKGDGALLDARTALARPVETILSGPAASVVGARYLSGRQDVFVADMGGTTTDIALLRGGFPVLSPDGAVVGGWRTMVEAVAVHTFGLGGDSEVHFDGLEGLALGPRRVVPLSLLAHQHPTVLQTLREEADRPAEPHDGQFVLRHRPLDTEGGLSAAQARLWAALAEAPVPLARLQTGYAASRALQRLLDRGQIIAAGFTPSDACHVLGRQRTWSSEAARLGAELFRRRQPGRQESNVEDFCRQVVGQVTRQAGRALVATALGETDGGALDGPGSTGWRLVERGLGESTEGLVAMSVRLGRAVVAIGAPAATYYPEVARRLHTELVLPPHAEVSNAIGAVAGSVVQKVVATITAPEEGRFRVHLPNGNRDFAGLEAAAECAVTESRGLALGRAQQAGAADIHVEHVREDNIVRGVGGRDIFIETKVAATATGRPRLAGAR